MAMPAGERQIIPDYTMKALKGSRRITPLYLNLGPVCR
jgi:hypothetical protein